MAEAIVEGSTGSSDRTLVFWLGILAMFNCGVAAAARASIAGALKREFLDNLDLARSATMIATALGTFFLGFTVTLVIASFLLDKVGMKRMLQLGGVFFVLSTLILDGCGFARGMAVYWAIVAAMFICGMGHACVEGTTNPMVASLYPDQTTDRMNKLHAWYPAGLILGALYGALGTGLGFDWRIIYLPVAILGVLFIVLSFGREFPLTTSSEMGVPLRDQFKEVFFRPTFLLWFALMWGTAAAEVAPIQWVDVALSNVVGMRGILLAAYVSAIQFVGRHFAGPVEKKLSTEGLMTLSLVLAAVGLFSLGFANSPVTAIASATSWGMGVCFLWPTMLSIAAERYPRGGAVTIGLLGAAGNLSIYFVLPLLGAIYDNAKLAQAGGAEAFARLSPAQANPVLVYAAHESFRAVALIPAALVAIFGVMWILHARGRAVGGYGVAYARGRKLN